MDCKTSQTRGPGWVTSQKIVTDDILFHLFHTFSPLLHRLKITKLNKTYISICKSSLSEGNFNPIWINTLGHLLLDTIYDYPVWFTLIANIVSSNRIPHMLVPFIVVPVNSQAKFQARESKRGHKTTQKLQAQREK